MTKPSEYIIYTLLTIVVFMSMIYILFATEYLIIIFVPMIIYLGVIYWIKKNKKITEFVKDDFKKLGFEIISERPLKQSEREIEIEPAVLTSGNTPLRKNKNRFNRIFSVKDDNNRLLELKAEIIEKKNGKIKITIKDKKTIANNVQN
ncbi:hypothetical protein SAMN05444411_1533 [Lutibacter oricola]|uniref:Uncharacterized protein n=1 Tax=Lutibacter oricola TaxID=762486 RepID=A0A1H3HQF6_9FLAO|nr:hypothetical protein [Lutibacter oricola]SDY17707.1 hypothetical protein SAMN05444411_1533 [Lutibacter oricola]